MSECECAMPMQCVCMDVQGEVCSLALLSLVYVAALFVCLHLFAFQLVFPSLDFFLILWSFSLLMFTSLCFICLASLLAFTSFELKMLFCSDFLLGWTSR